jgi:hypothetical protein
MSPMVPILFPPTVQAYAVLPVAVVFDVFLFNKRLDVLMGAS